MTNPDRSDRIWKVAPRGHEIAEIFMKGEPFEFLYICYCTFVQKFAFLTYPLGGLFTGGDNPLRIIKNIPPSPSHLQWPLAIANGECQWQLPMAGALEPFEF